ncbi:hypothetical protein CC80DRAFT_552879 [Byssothecium circinans]|uniref:Uncharacterized protein n=1 Tax=Byssothecium circinans TaxID=147558 RepID=A0A6A5TG55_9PLEO|nr:hypothetical protein CC80DRAFT_552879 [Byssothecium circinans]
MKKSGKAAKEKAASAAVAEAAIEETVVDAPFDTPVETAVDPLGDTRAEMLPVPSKPDETPDVPVAQPAEEPVMDLSRILDLVVLHSREDEPRRPPPLPFAAFKQEYLSHWKAVPQATAEQKAFKSRLKWAFDAVAAYVTWGDYMSEKLDASIADSEKALALFRDFVRRAAAKVEEDGEKINAEWKKLVAAKERWKTEKECERLDVRFAALHEVFRLMVYSEPRVGVGLFYTHQPTGEPMPNWQHPYFLGMSFGIYLNATKVLAPCARPAPPGPLSTRDGYNSNATNQLHHHDSPWCKADTRPPVDPYSLQYPGHDSVLPSESWWAGIRDALDDFDPMPKLRKMRRSLPDNNWNGNVPPAWMSQLEALPSWFHPGPKE